jgi:hypothetical protein
MRSAVEITRQGDRPIADQIAEMHSWLAEAGIPVSNYVRCAS